MTVWENTHKITYVHFCNCLTSAGQALKVTQPELTPGSTFFGPRHLGVNRAIRRSIAILAKMISLVVDEAFRQLDGPRIPLDSPQYFKDD